MSNPSHLRYTKDHEWVLLEGDTATIGITHYAQSELGDIVYVDIPNATGHFNTHEVFGTVETNKSVSDLFSPLSGTILEVNPEIDSSPGLVNEDPFGKGWMIKMKVDNAAEVDSLLTADQYESLIG